MQGWVYAAQTLDESGSVDIKTGLDAIDAGFAGNGGTVRFEKGTGNQYRLATNYTSPLNVKWWFDPEAMITVDGVVLTYLGVDGAWDKTKHFNCINGGKVRFYQQNSPADPQTALLFDVYPEWFGALPNGATVWMPGQTNWYTVTDYAFDLMYEAVRGWPHTPLSLPSTFKGRMVLGGGATYAKAKAWELVCGIAPSIKGGGRENTTILYVGGGVTATASSYPAANRVQLTGTLPPTLVGRWIVMAGPTHWGIAAEIVQDLGGGLVQTWGNHGYTATGQTVHLLEEAVIDLNGIHDARLSDFSISLASNAAIMAGLYYHRDSQTSIRGSSKSGFDALKIGGTRFSAGAFCIGSFDPGEYTWQEDLATFWHCEAFGAWHALTPNERSAWSTNGFRFGAAGIPSNPLNYTCHGCVSISWGNGVAILATNVRWDGGTIQSNMNDLYLFQGAQNYVSVSGFRSEGSQRLCYGYSGVSVGFNIYLGDIEFRAEALGVTPDTGTHDLAFFPWTGTAEIVRVRSIGGPNTGDHLSEGREYTAIGTDSGNGYLELSGAGWTANQWVGGVLSIWDVNDPIWWKGADYEVLSNTATRITIRGSWLTGSHAETGRNWPTLAPPASGRRFKATQVSRIRASTLKACNITVRDYIAGHVRLKQILPDLGVAILTWNVDIQPYDIRGPEVRRGAHGPVRFGPRSEGFTDYAAVSSGFASLHWPHHSAGKILLDANYTIPLGGNPWAGDPTNYPQVWFPAPDGEIIVEATQDSVGGRVLSFDTTKPIKWKGGAPSAGAANTVRRYHIRYRTTHFLISYEDYA
ncbi:MAG TPA: hypothetical protein VJ650_07175 [Gemmatimonadaceae bacterium]|nr:hypothetical protein [Gemmatimonadaceae bacterium]